MTAKITKITGKARIKNPSTGKEIPAIVGTEIKSTKEIVIISPQSTVEVICGNGKQGIPQTEGRRNLSDFCPPRPSPTGGRGFFFSLISGDTTIHTDGLDESVLLEVRKKYQEITKQAELSTTEKALKMAEICEEIGCFEDAVSILESLAEENKNVDVYQKLGQFYHYYIKSPEKAEINYQKSAYLLSLQLAITQWKLAEVKICQDKKEEAKTLLKSAITNLYELKDEDMVAYLKQKLTDL